MAPSCADIVTQPIISARDLSGDIGPRLLQLLSRQAEHSLEWMAADSRRTGIPESKFAVPPDSTIQRPQHLIYKTATSVREFAVLACFGEPGRTMGGVSRERLIELAKTMIRAVIATHPLSGGSGVRAHFWRKWAALRLVNIFGMGAWLLWDELEPELQARVARIFAFEADRFNNAQAPALLFDDTQGESNAWTASGLALTACMLKQHPNQPIWAEKAKEFMISAYATADDVASDRVVDGKPLNQWLHAPNAFPDYTVENHGFIHPIYMAAISEMVRTAIGYRLAGDPVPEAATFNADHVLDALLWLNLPDGNHLYLQGTDYDPRRIDSFLQVCNVIPLKPNPLREAAFRRVLDSMERMAGERPDIHMSGNIMFPFDFGTSWGLTENYLMRRLFGSPVEAIPEAHIDAHLTGVHVNEAARFAVHRTEKSISSFSWHAIERSAQAMGFTMPLDPDVLVCTSPSNSYIGTLNVAGISDPPPLNVPRYHVQAQTDGFGVVMMLERCANTITQNCAFVSLPDGRSVYLEQRVAREPISLLTAESGTVRIYDDLRWPFQQQPRVFHASGGTVQPDNAEIYLSQWVNVDDRLGFAVLGLTGLTLRKQTDNYHTIELAFVDAGAGAGALEYGPDDIISNFAMITIPNQTTPETQHLAGTLQWQIQLDNVLAVLIDSYLVYANFNDQPSLCPTVNGSQLPPWTAGWQETEEL